MSIASSPTALLANARRTQGLQQGVQSRLGGLRWRPFSSAARPHHLRVQRWAAAGPGGKESTAAREEPLKVPDSTAARPLAPQAAEAEEGLSVEDIQQRAAELRAAAAKQELAQQQAGGKESFWQGVLEEVGLIRWPSPKQAVLNTVLVIAIVGGTSALLFAVNTLLTELSRVVYG